MWRKGEKNKEKEKGKEQDAIEKTLGSGDKRKSDEDTNGIKGKERKKTTHEYNRKRR